VTGFDFSRDPFDAKKPLQTFEETMQADIDAKPGVMAAQRKLLESCYNLTPRQDPNVKMSRGKPVPVGPTARLADGMTWDRLAAMKAEDIRSRKLFPYLALPPPKHATGGQIFPQMQLSMFPDWNGSTLTSICRRRSCRSSRPQSSCRAGPNWVMYRAGKWSPSTISAGCSRI